MTVNFGEQLKRQLRFLQTSCDRYDAGDVDEAIRISVTLRVLFHHTKGIVPGGTSISLLKHLGATSIALLSTCDPIPKGCKFLPNLSLIKLDPSAGMAQFVPKLSNAVTNRQVPFTKWWKTEIVSLHRAEGITLTRKDLVLSSANTDGGAHVDATRPAKYEKIMGGASWKMTRYRADGSILDETPFVNAHLAGLRQIAFEVLNSSKLLALAP